MTIRPDLFMWFPYAGRADVVVDNDKGEMR